MRRAWGLAVAAVDLAWAPLRRGWWLARARAEQVAPLRGEWRELERQAVEQTRIYAVLGFVAGALLVTAQQRWPGALPLCLLGAMLAAWLLDGALRLQSRYLVVAHLAALTRRAGREKVLMRMASGGSLRLGPAIQGRCSECRREEPARHDRSCPRVPAGWFTPRGDART